MNSQCFKLRFADEFWYCSIAFWNWYWKSLVFYSGVWIDGNSDVRNEVDDRTIELMGLKLHNLSVKTTYLLGLWNDFHLHTT